MFTPGGGDSSQHPAPHHQQPNRDYQAHIAHQTEEVSGQVEDHFRTARASPGRTYECRHEPHSPPVRDAASIKGVKYGSGHEKFPSWPTSAAAEAPAATRSPPTGGSHRSKSWTDHTHYPKENLVLYTRPYMKRHRHQQLKPVFEAADRTMPGPFKGHMEGEGSEIFEEEKNYEEREDGFAEKEYGLPPPPGREVPMLQNLSEYSTTYEVKEVKAQYFKYQSGKESKKLTQAELEEYTKNYEESLSVQHQKQSSYAQSEGYHSYVSSTDSTSTPFLDRLRREADSSVSRSDSGLSSAVGGAGAGWDTARGDRDSVVTTSSGSGSSSETLKWHGSLSDISVASSSLSLTSKQLIAHSAKVKTPQRHGSESVLYIARPSDSEIEHRTVPSGNCQKHLKLFPVSTYAVPESMEQRQNCNNRLNVSYSPPQMTVAERVNELERQNKYAAYHDSKRQSRVGDPNLKAKQKSALLSFYERQQQKENKQSWRSEPQLASCQPPPPPQAKPQQTTSRRASSASDYADWRDRDPSKPHLDVKSETPTTPEIPILSHPLNIPNSTRFSPNSALVGPIIVGPVISLDDWVPERPPKNAKLLRNVFPDLYHQDERLPSPDLPLPSPPTVIEDEVFNDEPFPPPPSEITEWKYEQEVSEQLACDNLNITRSPVVESVVRPSPICSFSPIKLQEYAHDKQVLRGMNENTHPVKRPTDLPLDASNILPFSHNHNKKLLSNLNEKPLRSSFRTNQDNPLHPGMAQDIRASMRYYRSNVSLQHKGLSSQKPVISAQKLLFRSTTVDDTSTSPKRPINPFLRSTSLRQNGPCLKSMPSTPQLQKYPSDTIQNARHSSGPTTFNGNTSNSETPKETTGRYRPECDKSKSVVSKIEQLQQILKGPVDRADVRKKESTGSLNAPVVTSSFHGAKKLLHSGPPPPLYPKQSVPGVPVKPFTTDRTGGSPIRGNDNVCYAPSRAKLPDPSVGSYKLIQQNEQPPCPKPSTLAELIMPAAEVKPTYPSFEYITRRTCEKLLSLPHEYSKKSVPETQMTPPPSNKNKNYDPKYQETTPTERLIEIEEEIAKNIVVGENKKTTQSDDGANQIKPAAESNTKPHDISNEHDEKVEDDAPILTQPVLVEDEMSAEEYKQTALELPEVTQWSETVPALEEFAQARRQLLEVLPADHPLHHLASLTHDQRNPIVFIRDFFGEAPSSGAEIQRREDGAKAPAEGVAEAKAGEQKESSPSVEQLKSDVLRCSERLVASLEAASEATTTAMSSNEQLGANILQRLSAPLSTKFTSHHTEVYQISSLMAALSARLARTYDDTERRRPEGKQMEELRSKKMKLEEQLVEARSLKENIDARACTMAEKMEGALDGASFRDYRLFMAVKPRLIIRARHLQYRLDYERDRLKGLQQSLGDR